MLGLDRSEPDYPTTDRAVEPVSGMEAGAANFETPSGGVAVWQHPGVAFA